MSSKDRFLQPPLECRPLYLWAPDWRGGAKWITQRLEELRAQGWGGVILRGAVELACARAAQRDEGAEEWETVRKTALAVIAVETARKKGLEVWLDALGIHRWGELGPWRRGADALARRRSLRFIAMRDVLSAETVRWELPRCLIHPLILGVTEGGHVMDVTRLYHDGVVEGMVPLAVARFIALEETRDPRISDPYDPDSFRSMLTWALDAVTTAYGNAGDALNGLYLDAMALPPGDPDAVPWSDAFRDQFTLKYKADVFETLPWLFLPGEGKAILHRTRFWEVVRECEADGFQRVLGEEAQARGWRIAQAARIGVSMGSMAELAALADQALADGADRIAYHPNVNEISSVNEIPSHNEIAPAEAAGDSLPPVPREPFEPWLYCFVDYCARLSAFAQAEEETVSALILTPQTARMRFSLDAGDQHRVRDVHDQTRRVRETLRRNQYNYEEIGEDALAELQIDEEMLLCRHAGRQRRRYAILVMPPTPIIGKRAADALVQLAEKGALILFAGGVPEILCENGERASLRELLDDAIEEIGSVKIAGEDWLRVLYEWVPPALRIPRRAELLRYRRFTLPDGEAALLVNRSDSEAFQGEVESLAPGGSVLLLDAVTGEITTPISDAKRSIELTIPPNCSSLLWFRRVPVQEGEALATEARITDHKTFTGPFVFFAEGENAYPLGHWELVDEVLPGEDEHSDGPQRRMSTRFWVSGGQRSLRLVGWGWAPKDANLVLNGVSLAPHRNSESLICDLSPHLHEGMNSLTIVYPSTESEPVPEIAQIADGRSTPAAACPPSFMLRGDFIVHDAGGEEILIPPTPRIGSGSWTLQGYPYYSGVGVYRLRVSIPEEYTTRRLFLRLEDIRHAAEVRIETETAGVIWRAPRRLEITGRMRPGDNVLELRVANTLRNLIGRRRVPSGLLGAVHLEVGERVL